MRPREPYCDRSAELGDGFPDLVGGLVGLGVGLMVGTVRNVRRIRWGGGRGGCSCGCSVRHVYVVHDCGPCAGCCCR